MFSLLHLVLHSASRRGGAAAWGVWGLWRRFLNVGSANDVAWPVAAGTGTGVAAFLRVQLLCEGPCCFSFLSAHLQPSPSLSLEASSTGNWAPISWWAFLVMIDRLLPPCLPLRLDGVSGTPSHPISSYPIPYDIIPSSRRIPALCACRWRGTGCSRGSRRRGVKPRWAAR